MSNKDSKTVEESGLEAVEVTLSKTERYIEDNKNELVYNNWCYYCNNWRLFRF